MKKYMTIKMPDGSTWAVPTEIVARNRAEAYANEFRGDVEQSLLKDTIPLFESDQYEIQDWAENNMYWDDFGDQKVKVFDAKEIDFEEGLTNGDKKFVDEVSPC